VPQIMGFDRKIKLNWLEQTAWRASTTDDIKEIRSSIEEYLEKEIKGAVAKRKTTTILFRIWVQIPEEHEEMQKRALKMLPNCQLQERIALHWGMAALAYPFFRDLASICGRLLSLQNEISNKQITRRMAELWGDKETVNTSSYRIVRSLVDWGVLADTEKKGFYKAAPRLPLGEGMQLWLLEALLRSGEVSSVPVEQLFKLPQGFPFELDLPYSKLRQCKNFEIQRQSLDLEMVSVREL
jgi:hypothetical protein